ncbi:hypothetical protein [Mycobacterium sp. E802]|uniref:hypothetical protein n=1 Tax=Mycobacterium sp. E802 TaxID=1834152 RepID=UPI000B03B9D7|nr:hypothetical protein [Mycobacterium sp. E802]
MVHLRIRLTAVGGAVFAASALFSGCGSDRVTVTDSAPGVTPRIVGASVLTNRQVNEPTSFSSPSGSVRCRLDAELARCDVTDRSWAPPMRPASCEFDYGRGISVRPGRPAAFVCATDTTPQANTQLSERESITAGTLRCESAGTGIRCRDMKSRHGFAISRQGYQLF